MVGTVFQTITADPLEERDHQRIAHYMETHAGIQMPPAKKTLIESRLRKRQRALQFQTLKSYIAHVFETADGEQELLHLVDALTTNKTDFYREAQHFSFLRQHLASRNNLQSGGCHFWSAGCSTGEEPYTLAMEMLEFKREHHNFEFDILATDISASCLQTAKKAVYDHSKIEPVDMALRRRYLLRSRDKADGVVKMAPELTERVRFQFFNLITDSWAPLADKFDFIFCRNVMIYFSNEDRAELTRRFHHALAPGGILFIGHSESLIDEKRLFSRIRPTIYRKESQPCQKR